MSEPGTDDNLLPFRRKTPPILWSDGRVQTECDGLVHLFASIPGRCQCGERTWEVAPDIIQLGTDQPGISIDPEGE